ncbi:hypothetical protein KLP28_06990 [Nocardioidaceae bacterium]|nr:hypothetical protein KLP28_06990 [Nocardioidaceae bacterium]
MAYVGIAVRIEQGKPRLRGVVLDGTNVATFDYLAPDTDDVAEKIIAISDGLDGRLSALSAIERIVVRQGDDGARGGLTGPTVLRLRAEGAAIYIARQYCSDVRVFSGPQVGTACGNGLADAEEQAKKIAAAKWKVAASAALAARSVK